MKSLYFCPLLVTLVFFSISHVCTFAAGLNLPDPSKFDIRGFVFGMSFEAARNVLSNYDKDNRMVTISDAGVNGGSYRLETWIKNNDDSEDWYELWFTCDKLGKRLYEVIYTIKHYDIVDADQFVKKVLQKYGMYTDSCHSKAHTIEEFRYTWGFLAGDMCDTFNSHFPYDKVTLEFEVTLERPTFDPDVGRSETVIILHDGVLDMKNEELTKQSAETQKKNRQKNEADKLNF